MRRDVWSAAAVIVALIAVGCSSEQPTTPTTTSDLPPLPAQPVPPQAVGVSPGGVTTEVDVPSDATESQYGQACRAAALWMAGRAGDPVTLTEQYLQVLQAPGAVGPGTFDTTWDQLTPAQQAGVVMAVEAAADGDCL